ncbi:hypothetical protein [Noviherbaspirillum sp.]|uniref:hypothetical protein n=1 Tax=Noviherbaspirillum sp. TaxID=1926288 RepID=UPI002D2A72FD|nr:hypothetical protein [Noviherbaspirillum sp.]HZW21105.1 hypothetical protein [Noviherbaspirillum sp.]
MNAQTVWNVWRRIMREPALQQALLEERGEDLSRFAFSEPEKQAALAYARDASRAKWFVLNYRFRLANSFINALETGAPLVLRALLRRGADLRGLGERFLDMHGWKDYGPFVYGYCRDALEFLAQDDCTAQPAGLRDLIGLEMTVVDLLRSLAAAPDAGADENTAFLRRTPLARHYRSRYRLSDWLRDKTLLGQGDLPAGVQDYLVYLTDYDSTYKFALLPPRAVEILQALTSPCLPVELSSRLAASGAAPLVAADDKHLALLKGCRAISGKLG